MNAALGFVERTGRESVSGGVGRFHGFEQFGITWMSSPE